MMSDAPDNVAWLAALDYSAILDSAPGALMLVDAQGIIRLVNKQTESIFGYAREKLAGEPVEVLVPVDFASDHRSLRGSYFKSPTIRNMAEVVGDAARASGEALPSLPGIDAEAGLEIALGRKDLYHPHAHSLNVVAESDD